MINFMISAMIIAHVNAIYFFLEPGMERCFKDEVVKNYVSTCINSVITLIFMYRL